MMDLQSTKAERYEIALKIRDIYFNHGPDIIEDIKYDGLVFLKGKQLIGGLFFYQSHASIEFSEGANLSDPDSTLEGKGKLRRHIKITSCGDIQTRNVSSYVKEALGQYRAKSEPVNNSV
ncbi:DUF1801 domain-containing protein [Endozoicomonas atrinae]|uniref:DUF1801 domain-containing protein n=1 Tax=Endozoicomonas atrinae TaxID=1333660 RepID=UPI001EE6F60F|nr:DUF1801 domain-containing protein [Endozoicomonas atrinae]